MPATPSGYYVYELRDPSTGEAFYVGKGKGRRAWSHEREARRNAGANAIKRSRISAICASGERPTVVIVADGLLEDEALKLERELIGASREQLTNIAFGSRGRFEIVAAACAEDLRTIKPLCVLLKEGASWEVLTVWSRVVTGLAGIRTRAAAI